MRPRRVCATALGLVLLLAGCDAASGSRTGPAGRTTHAQASAPSSDNAGHPIRVVRWGLNDGLLSVAVENISRYEIRSARAVITALDSSGTIVASASGPPTARCCTILGVPPHGQFGLYTVIGQGARRTASVAVDLAYVDAVPVPESAPRITIAQAALVSRRPVAVVDAVLTAHAATGPYVIAQAFLTDSRRRFMAVVSGRFYCMAGRTASSIRLQLFHPVPEGARLQRVVAYAVPAGVSSGTLGLPACGA